MNQLEEIKTGATIRLYLADGIASGIRIVSRDNWSGVAIDCSRKDLSRASLRPELSRAGVYVLADFEDSDSGLPQIYVGQAEELGKRVGEHAKKLFLAWRRVVVFTSTDSSLNKAHAEYLESRLCQIANGTKQCVLVNKTMPSAPKLSDSDRDQAEVFLREVRLILPVLGVTAFDTPDSQPPTTEDLVFELEVNHGTAKGVETTDGFKVFEGAVARLEEQPAASNATKQLRADLAQIGAMVPALGGLMLTQDHVFNSPSAAASVLLGSSVNGRTAWRLPDGRTLKEVQEADLQGIEQLPGE